MLLGSSSTVRRHRAVYPQYPVAGSTVFYNVPRRGSVLRHWTVLRLLTGKIVY